MSTLKSREEMNELYTWDLTSMYADDAAQEADAEAVKAMFPKLAEFSGKLAEGPEVLADALDLIGEAARKMSNVYVYAHLKNDQDATNSTYQEMYAKATQLYGQFGETVAYFEPELNTIPEATLTQFIDENDRLKHYQQHLDNMGRGRAHVLPQEQELLLAQASEVFQGASNTFGLLNNADLVFPTIKDEEGKEVQLTHSLYSIFLESSDRRVRKETFEKFYSVYDQFKNTMASILSTNIKVNNYDAKVHKFESARQAALFTNNIPESVYDTLVDTVNKRLDL